MKILEIFPEQGTMLIHWESGLTLNHLIPEALRDNPDMSAEDLRTLLEAERPEDGPEAPVYASLEQIPDALKELAKPTCLAEATFSKTQEFAEKHSQFLQDNSMKYSDMERETWDAQRAEAEALLAAPDASAPLVRAIAKTRNMDVMELAERIQLKAQDWAKLAGHAIGQRLAYQDTLDDCTTVEEIQDITVEFSELDEA